MLSLYFVTTDEKIPGVLHVSWQANVNSPYFTSCWGKYYSPHLKLWLLFHRGVKNERRRETKYSDKQNQIIIATLARQI